MISSQKETISSVLKRKMEEMQKSDDFAKDENAKASKEDIILSVIEDYDDVLKELAK